MTSDEIKIYLEVLGFEYDKDYEETLRESISRRVDYKPTHWLFHYSDIRGINRNKDIHIDNSRLHVGRTGSYDLEAIDMNELLRIIDGMFSDSDWEKDICTKYKKHRSIFEAEVRDYKLNRILE